MADMERCRAEVFVGTRDVPVFIKNGVLRMGEKLFTYLLTPERLALATCTIAAPNTVIDMDAFQDLRRYSTLKRRLYNAARDFNDCFDAEYASRPWWVHFYGAPEMTRTPGMVSVLDVRGFSLVTSAGQRPGFPSIVSP